MTSDPFAEVKRAVLDRLHPRPSGTRVDVEQRIRQALQEVLSTGEMPLTARDRARIAGELCDDLDV